MKGATFDAKLSNNPHFRRAYIIEAQSGEKYKNLADLNLVDTLLKLIKRSTYLFISMHHYLELFSVFGWFRPDT